MKKKLKLKPFVIPAVYTVFAVAVIIGLFLSIDVIEDKDNLTYVSKTILDEYVPVVNIDAEEKILKPFTDTEVKVINDYYDYTKEDNQITSILEYEGTYIQNTGINYSKENIFDVISILNGEVIEVEDKELLGKTVTIRHDKNIISVYQSLGEVSVKKGDKVLSGQVIGKSGSCDLIKESSNNLHFELYINGVVENPNNYFDKNINEI